MPRTTLLSLLAAAALPVNAAQVPTQLPRSARPTHYDISVTPDAGTLKFSGRVVIGIDVLEPTSSLTLNAIDMTFPKAELQDAAGKVVATAKVSVDAAAQSATFTFPLPLVPKAYRLALDYTGRIGTQAVGLFALDYDTAQGRKRALFTQFENSDARRFVPCFDEPIYKATFALSATIPHGELAVSNMPAAETKALPDGRSLVRFATTPKMSSYLLFFALGDLERATTKTGDTEVGVVTKRGATDQAAFALAASAEILKEYNDYFGRPYPLPKLDNVAAPGRSQFFGAMENWGAIATFEYILLLDPTISTEADRQNIFSVDAHEISHQWFGDLVTMAWWDDLWLNEGFASWMAGRTTRKLRPEWHHELRAVTDRDKAMERDALAATHPIVQRIETVEQASQAFDPITYEKGEAVIRMLEGYVGADAWRDGVRRYIAAHAYGSTVSGDLWSAIESATGQPIQAIAHDFTLQPGIPLIGVGDVVCKDGRSEVALVQGEFTRDRPGKKPLAWKVPVILKTLGSTEEARVLVSEGKVTVSVPGCGPLVVNAGQSGYYRAQYTPAAFERLASAFPQVAAIDQLGLLTDTWALGQAGLQPASDVLDLAKATPAEADPQLWGRFAAIFGEIDEYARVDGAQRAAFRKFAIARLAPVFARLGWSARASEPAQDTILRAELIARLGALGDAGVVAEARRRYASSDPAAMPAALRKAILAVVARNSDAATWDKLHASAAAEKTPLVKDQLYRLLSSSEDATLARRALDLALTDEPGATNSAEMISTVAKEHPDLAFAFALEHRSVVDGKVDPTSGTRYYARLAEESADKTTIVKLRDYADKYLDPKSRGEADRVCGTVADRILTRDRTLPVIEAWLVGHAD